MPNPSNLFVRAPGQVRDAFGFHPIGYVLMPEHFHLLLWPAPQANPSLILQSLKGRTALPATAPSAPAPADRIAVHILQLLLHLGTAPDIHVVR